MDEDSKNFHFIFFCFYSEKKLYSGMQRYIGYALKNILETLLLVLYVCIYEIYFFTPSKQLGFGLVFFDCFSYFDFLMTNTYLKLCTSTYL